LARRKKKDGDGKVKVAIAANVDAQVLHEFREIAIEWYRRKRGRLVFHGAFSEAVEKAMRLFVEAWRRGELDYE